MAMSMLLRPQNNFKGKFLILEAPHLNKMVFSKYLILRKVPKT